jgi:hypothetical protein
MQVMKCAHNVNICCSIISKNFATYGSSDRAGEVLHSPLQVLSEIFTRSQKYLTSWARDARRIPCRSSREVSDIFVRV